MFVFSAGEEVDGSGGGGGGGRKRKRRESSLEEGESFFEGEGGLGGGVEDLGTETKGVWRVRKKEEEKNGEKDKGEGGREETTNSTHLENHLTPSIRSLGLDDPVGFREGSSSEVEFSVKRKVFRELCDAMQCDPSNMESESVASTRNATRSRKGLEDSLLRNH